MRRRARLERARVKRAFESRIGSVGREREGRFSVVGRRDRLGIDCRLGSAVVEGQDELRWTIAQLVPAVQCLLVAYPTLGGIPDQQTVIGRRVEALHLL